MKVRTSKFLVGVLSVTLLVSLILLGKAYWEIYGFTGWKKQVWLLSSSTATMQALADFKKGDLRLLKIEGKSDKLKFSGQREGPFEIWIVQYYPILGRVHKYSTEQYVDYYNRKMRYMHDHPDKFKTDVEKPNGSIQQVPLVEN